MRIGVMGVGNYVLRPAIKIRSGEKAVSGWQAVAESLTSRLSGMGERSVVAIECYPGTDHEDLCRHLIAALRPCLVLCSDDYSQDANAVQARIRDCITQDRVFGIMSHYCYQDFFEQKEIERAHRQIASAEGLVVVYGCGTTLVCEPDLVLYASLTRWEIQLRYRRGLSNWKTHNEDEDPLRKFKRGYFFEWRVADREKRRLFKRIDYILDMNVPGDPRMMGGTAWREALAQVARRPYRMVPYFDSSVWGGHWMQEHFGLKPDAPNYGWAFDGVPEENSILLDVGGVELELPAQDVVAFQPVALMGPKVHARFGWDYPIRFDYLDTMGGGNLSLQVHPLTGYIQDRFGMTYTQDESYYILEATQESCVYLGVSDQTTKEALIGDLRRAAKGGFRFPDEAHVNRLPVSKHDHVHIPAGTLHCGGAETVILEISATPYIFTFKLWDWGRVGLDGIPRPVHIDHGARNILMERDTAFVRDRLIDRAADSHEDFSEEAGVRVERTGLNELEFIETRRYWFCNSATLETFESVNELNLVEGDSAVVESLDGSFEALEVHYGETFIVPECVGRYRIRNTGDTDREIAVIQAFVRNP